MKSKGFSGKVLGLVALLLSILAGFAPASSARTVTVAWDPNPPEEAVTGYIVYYGTLTRAAPGFTAYDGSRDVGNVTTGAVDLPDPNATYYLSVVAYNASGLRSDYSQEISTGAAAPSTFTLSATAGANGSISPSGSVSVASGGAQAFTITPQAGYRIAGVTVDGTSVGAVSSYTFSNVTANHSISATFAAQPVSYAITPSAGTGGSISPSGSTWVGSGGTQTFTITAASGYRISNVTVDGVSAGAVSSYTFSNVTANHTLSATFAAVSITPTPTNYTVTASAGTGGSISPSGNVSVAAAGGQSFAISAASGYRIADVKVDGVSVGAVSSYAFSKVAADHTITATFAAQQILSYTVMASAGANGTITPSGSVSVAQAASRTFTIAPAKGYRIADVLVDGASVGAVGSYTFQNVTANHSIVASFSAKLYKLRLQTNAYGTAVVESGTAARSPSAFGSADELSVQDGSSVTLAFVPEPGYAVADVTVDGVSVGAVTTYTLDGIDADHAVSAVFQAVDADDDGLADLWERLYFGGLDRDGTSDFDEDGLDDATEYAQGTDPTVPDLDDALSPVAWQPVSGGTVSGRTPTLVVHNPLGSETVTFEFQIATDRTMTNLIASQKDVGQGVGVTAWTLPSALADKTRYYWRARAGNGQVSSPWTEPATFVVDTAAPETVAKLEFTGYISAAAENGFQVDDAESAVKGLAATVPAGALDVDRVFTVETVQNAPAPTPEIRLLGKPVELGPTGVSFEEPATLMLPYSLEELAAAGVASPTELKPFTYNTRTLRWEALTVERVDVENRRIVCQVPHFSMYALGLGDAAPSFDLKLKSAAKTFSYKGGPLTLSFTVQGAPGETVTVWTVPPENAAWVSVAPGQEQLSVKLNARGVAKGKVALRVARYWSSGNGPRQALVTIGDETFTVTQTEAPCTVSLSPKGSTLPASGGEQSFLVTAPEGCGWTVTPGASWLQLLSDASGTGSGSVVFAAGANDTGKKRTANVSISLSSSTRAYKVGQLK